MSEWRSVTLVDIAELGVGATPSRSELAFWSHSSNGHPWATIADLRNDPVYETAERITDLAVRVGRGRLVPPGTPLMSFKLTVGRVARAGRSLFTNEAIVSVAGRPGLADRNWLYHALPRIAATGVTDTAVKGSTLNKAKLERLSVSLPPLAEQQRIARILDSLDQAVAAMDRVLVKLRSEREGIESALIDPGIGTLSSGPEAAPSGWALGQLGDFIHLQRGFDITQSQQRRGPIPVVSSGGVLSYHDRSMAPAPGVVIGRKGKLGRVYYLDTPYWPHDTTLWVTDFGRNQPHFVAALLRRLRLERLDAATSVPTLNRNFVHPLRIAIPPLEEQTKIVAALASVDAAILSEESRARKLRALGAGLADDLLSGRVRTVPV